MEYERRNRDTGDRRGLADRLLAAVREAGALVQSFERPLKTWTKGQDSPVTEADIAVDRLLRARLIDEASDIGWLSEESEDDRARLAARRLWIIDPIDGTRAFVAGRADWSISAALVEDGRPVIAAVFAPAEGQLYFAIAGEGATCNGVPIATSDDAGLDGARIGGPRRHVERLAALCPGIVAEPRVHSLALRLARVAHGRLDAAFVSANSCDWDLAAADLLVHEANGALTTLSGEAPTYNRLETNHQPLVAAGRSRHRTLVDLVRGRQNEFR
jgi:myo-inositol-1(or 4)-monophosphatase